MNKIKKLSAAVLILTVLSLGAGSRAFADDTMQNTLKDAVYGGVIGALIGSAVVLLTDNPGDHLDYIATGAGVGILGGAAYGLATSGIVRSAGEIENGKLTLNMPTIQTEKVFDRNTNSTEVINKVELVKLRF